MPKHQALDELVKQRLRTWPQRPPGLGRRQGGCENWFRGRPSRSPSDRHPYLKLPGCAYLRTIPDGLWLNIGGTVNETYVDVFAVEACGSLGNLRDKRSRFVPSTQSLLAVCPVRWLMARSPADDRRRWETIAQMQREPHVPLVAPVRDMRVLYALKQEHYDQVEETLVPYPHEYFVPMDALTAIDGDRSPALHQLMSRACATASFLKPVDFAGYCGD
jgi:hypothetical protein